MTNGEAVGGIEGNVMQFFGKYAVRWFLQHRVDDKKEQSVLNALSRDHIGQHEFPRDAKCCR